jgi:replicative DNA helicase
MKFDIDFEETILSKCLRNQVYLKKAAPLLEVHHFGSPQHSWVWKSIKHIWDTYREMPNGRLIVMRAQHDFTKPEELKAHLELIRKIAHIKPQAATATLAELEQFVRAVNAQRVLEEAAKELEKEHIEKAWEILNAASRQDIKPRNYHMIHWIEEFEERQRERKFNAEHPDAVARVPTGFKHLDNILGGGIEMGEMGLVMGTTGKGKSIMLCNLAYWGAACGYPTIYFTMEMSARQVAQRMDSRWAQYEYNKFKKFDFMPSELRRLDTRRKYAMRRFSDKLVIVETPVRKTTVVDLERIIDDLNEDVKFVPKMLVIDSGDHMSSVRRYESYRLEQADVYWNLSGMAQQGYAVWSSVQAGKEFAKQVAHAEAASESYDKSRIADLVISINTPEKKTRSTRVTTDDGEGDAEEEHIYALDGKYMELFISKYRDGEDKITIPVDAQFAKMYIKELEKDEA